jgi:NAD(P)-dependent dehydrogenase (short-subunit alcohol dehydrogenase family)
MKTILITGAAGNLGRAVVKTLRASGYDIIAVDATPPAEEFINAEGITPVQLDLGNETAVVEFVSDLQSNVNGAVLTVGGFAMGDFEQTTLENVQSMFQLNFETAFNCVKALMPVFEKQNAGQFILVGARPALDAKAGKNMIAYALSKKLVFGLSELINAHGKSHQITSTVIVPSTIDTPANRKSMPEADFSKWVTADAIAETSDFLFSAAGSQIREGVVKMYNEA